MNPKIERSNLYGKERTVIVNSSLTQPVNLVIDKQSERLFWLDGDLKSSDFNGSNIVTYNITQDNYTTFVIYKVSGRTLYIYKVLHQKYPSYCSRT